MHRHKYGHRGPSAIAYGFHPRGLGLFCARRRLKAMASLYRPHWTKPDRSYARRAPSPRTLSRSAETRYFHPWGWPLLFPPDATLHRMLSSSASPVLTRGISSRPRAISSQPWCRWPSHAHGLLFQSHRAGCPHRVDHCLWANNRALYTP